MNARPSTYVCPSSATEAFSTIPSYANRDLKPATGDYAFCAGHRGAVCCGVDVVDVKTENSGMFVYLNARKIRHLKDGTAKTFAVGETFGGHHPFASNIWSYFFRHQDSMRTTERPLNTPLGNVVVANGDLVMGTFGSGHTGGANFAYGDGHVEFIGDDIEELVYQSASTIDGGELVSGLQ